jgi:translation initiation factor IF-1
MSTSEKKTTGIVEECLPNVQYKIMLENGKQIRAYLSGKMKMNRIKVMIGDKVELIVPDKGEIYRVVYRF